jgi:hypothetical protein
MLSPNKILTCVTDLQKLGVDGALILYDVMNRDSITDLPQTLSRFPLSYTRTAFNIDVYHALR